MKADVILGLQWGDEGKGKIVDVLTPHYGIVARFQGGPNAGHTLEFENQKYILKSIPSGIFQEGKINVIGNGVVIDPALFKKEVDALEASGHMLAYRLYISRKAHLILPTHRLLDAASEKRAERRLHELLADGEDVTYEQVVANLCERDRTDASRPVAPLVRPRDAICIDTTALTIGEVLDELVRHLAAAGLLDKLTRGTRESGTR